MFFAGSFSPPRGRTRLGRNGAIDAALIFAVGRMLAAEVFRGPAPEVLCAACGATDGRKVVPVCAACIRATIVEARQRERGKILGGPEVRN